MDRRGHGGGGRDRRQERRAAAVRGPDLARANPDGYVEPPRDRAARGTGGPGDRRGARPGCESAAPGDRGHGGRHASGRGRRRHLDRSGGLFRDVAHERRIRNPDLRVTRRGPLPAWATCRARRSRARRRTRSRTSRSPYAVEIREPKGWGARYPPRPGAGARRERLRRRGDEPRGRGGARHAADAARRARRRREFWSAPRIGWGTPS